MSVQTPRQVYQSLRALIDELYQRVAGVAALVVTSPALTVPNWFVDPQNVTGLANDENTGQSASTPLLHVSRLAQILGGFNPKFAAGFNTNVHMLSDTNAADPFDFEPVTGNMTVICTLTQQATGTFTAVTARVQSTATRWTGTTASFGSWAPFVGMLYQDDSQAPNTWGVVDADLGGGVAQLTQPMQSSISAGYNPAAQGIVAAPDAFTIWRPSVLHTSLTGGTNQNAGVIVQHANVSSPLGLGGLTDVDSSVIFQECTFSAWVGTVETLMRDQLFPSSVAPNRTYGRPSFLNCWLNEGGAIVDGYIIGGAAIAVAQNLVLAAINQLVLNAGVYIEQSGSAHLAPIGPGVIRPGDSGWFVATAQRWVLGSTANGAGNGRVELGNTRSIEGTLYANPNMWGTVASNVIESTLFCVISADTFTARLLTTGNLTLDGIATGSTFTPTTGVWGPQSGGGSIALGAQPAASAAIDAAIAAGSTGVYAPGKFAGFVKLSH